MKASLELDEPLSWHPALRVSSDAGPYEPAAGWSVPRSLGRLATGFTGLTAPDINNAKSRFSVLACRARTVLTKSVQGR